MKERNEIHKLVQHILVRAFLAQAFAAGQNGRNDEVLDRISIELENNIVDMCTQVRTEAMKSVIEAIPDGIIDAEWPEHPLCAIKIELRSRFISSA